MSRYEESTGIFQYRAPLTVDLTGGGGAVDVSCTVPTAWPEFWDRILPTGADIRVVGPDGSTICTYDLQGFVYATKTLTLEVDNIDLTVAGSTMTTLWVYWGNPGAVDASTAFVPASAKTAYLPIEVPLDQYVVVVQPERQAQTKAAAVVVKKSSEVIDVYFDFSQVLRGRRAPYGGNRDYEEILCISLQDVQLSGASQAAMFTTAAARCCDKMARVQVKAGTSGVTYTIVCQITTTLGEVIEGRARLFVQTTSET